MIQRLYVDNFRTLVNFEWKPGKLALLLGSNGSGKTSVLETLWLLRSLVVNQEEVRRCFPSTSRPRWEGRLELTIELDVQVAQQEFEYRLVIQHSKDEPQKTRVKRETLRSADKVLMNFDLGELHLFGDDGSPGPTVTADWTRSGLGGIAPGRDNKRLTMFKQWLVGGLWFVRPDPRAMSGRTDQEAESLEPDLSNFASWLPRWMAEDFSGAMAATEALRKALDGYQVLQVSRTAPKLEARFRSSDGRDYDVDFSELSDGQRQLCALYFLRHAIVQPGRLVMFDEPDNYVALREIQPWLADAVEAALSAQGPQLFFVSHHPEILNQLAPEYGTLFFRDEGGPTRIRPFTGDATLSPAEVVARGWERE